MSKASVIRFQAQVAQVKTMADGGIRLSLDLQETAVDVAAKMMEVRQGGALLEIAAVAVKPDTQAASGDGFDFSDAFPGIEIKRVK